MSFDGSLALPININSEFATDNQSTHEQLNIAQQVIIFEEELMLGERDTRE